MLIVENAKKLFMVNKSYHHAFKSLNEQEINGLCLHDELLAKVHQELKSSSSELDIDFFSQTLQVIRNPNENNWRSLERFALNNNSNKVTNYFEHFFFKNSSLHTYLLPLRDTLVDRFGGIEAYNRYVNRSLYQPNGTFRLDAVQDLVRGFSIEDIFSYEKIYEAINLVALYVRDIWFTSEFTDILGFCHCNEKFVAILLYPYLLLPLGKSIWRTLFPVFTFVSGSFSKFMQQVSDVLGRGSFLLHKYRTLVVRYWIKLWAKGIVLGSITINTVKLVYTITSTGNSAMFSILLGSVCSTIFWFYF